MLYLTVVFADRGEEEEEEEEEGGMETWETGE